MLFGLRPVVILEMTIPVVLPSEPLFAVAFEACEGAWTPATLVNRTRDTTGVAQGLAFQRLCMITIIISLSRHDHILLGRGRRNTQRLLGLWTVSKARLRAPRHTLSIRVDGPFCGTDGNRLYRPR